MAIRIMCTKCGVEEADPNFLLERDTAYCLECAALLKLGTSREAQKMNQGVPHNAAIEEDDKEIESEETL